MKMLTKEEAAAEIADYDYQIDEGLRAVYRIMADDEDDPEEPLKLLKVNADTPEAGIMPLHFPPDIANGIPFAYELVVITPREFDRLGSADLRLPDDWRIGPPIHPPTRHPSGLLETAA